MAARKAVPSILNAQITLGKIEQEEAYVALRGSLATANRLTRAGNAWNRWSDADGFMRTYRKPPLPAASVVLQGEVDALLALGKVLSEDDWRSAMDKVTPADDAKQVALVLLEAAYAGDAKEVTALLRKLRQTPMDFERTARDKLGVEIRYDVLRVKPLIAPSVAIPARAITSTKPSGRDHFIYSRRAKGDTLQSILNKVNNKPQWEPLESLQGVSQAARRYATNHGMPWPIER